MAATRCPAPGRMRPVILAVCAALLAAAPAALVADDTCWQHDPTTPGDWFDPANWDNGVPQEGDYAYIDNGGTAEIGPGTASAGSLFVGNSGEGALSQTTGNLNLTDTLYISYNVGSQGAYYQRGGSVSLAYDLEVGYGDSGAYHMTGGALDARTLRIGYAGTGTSLFEHSGGGVYIGSLVMTWWSNPAGFLTHYILSGDGSLEAEKETIGWGASATATFAQNGGTNTVTEVLYVARRAYTIGRYELSQGTLSTNATLVAGAGGAQGTFVQTGGSHSVAGDLRVAASQGAIGAYELTGGCLSARNEYFRIEQGGEASFTQSGGTHTITDTLYLSYFVSICQPETVTYDLSAGDLRAQKEYVGYEGAAVFTQTGGSNTVLGDLVLARGEWAQGTYDLVEGALTAAGAEYVGLEGAATFSQSGGANTTRYLRVGPRGRYEYTGGALNIGSGLEVVGEFDFGGQPWSLNQDNVVLNFGSGGVEGVDNLCVTLGLNSLLVVPPGFDPSSAFAAYANDGLLHAAGATLVVPAGRGFSGMGHINDRVDCAGTIAAAENGWINLEDGLSVAPSGTVDLGGGTLSVNDQTSGMTGGALSAHVVYVGASGDGRFALAVSPGAPGSSGVPTLSCDELHVGYGNDSEGTFIQEGGAVEVRDALWVGYTSGASGEFGTYEISDGTFTADRTYMGDCLFRQTGGTVQVDSFRLSWGGTATYELEGGDLVADWAFVGHANGEAYFRQTGGVFTVATELSLAGDSKNLGAVYDLLGGNVVCDHYRLGHRKPGTFNQTGGNVETRLLSMGTCEGADGVYNLSGSGTLEADAEFVGLEGTATFNQSGGSNTTSYLSVGPGGRYEYTGGVLEVGGGLKVAGEVDFGDQTWSINGETFILNFAGGTLQRAGNVSVNLGTKALTIIPAGFDPASAVGSYATAGMTHVAGNTLVVPVGQGFGGSGEIDDPVQCAGEIVAGPGNFIDLAGGLTVADGGTVDLGRGTLAVNQGMSLVGAATLKVGTLLVGADGPATFSITDAAAQVTVSEALHVGPQGTLDVTTGGLTVLYDGASPFEEIHANVASGCHGGAWDGAGITSSAAAADLQWLTAVGVLDNSDPDPKLGGLTSFEGRPVDLSSVFVKYTWYGDANLDGVVDSNDYDMIDSAWLLWTTRGTIPVGGFRWGVGDFNYDGTLDSNDYDLIDRAWLLSGGAPLGGGAPVPTPEPASAALLLLAAGTLALHGRRRKQGTAARAWHT